MYQSYLDQIRLQIMKTDGSFEYDKHGLQQTLPLLFDGISQSREGSKESIDSLSLAYRKH